MEKGQSKLRSFLEANTNTFIGLVIQLVAAPLVYKLVGMEWVLWQLGASTLIFTIISVIRGYLIRRFFNKKEVSKDQELLNQIQGFRQINDDFARQVSISNRQANNFKLGYRELQEEIYQFFDYLKTPDVRLVVDNRIITAYLESVSGLINQIRLRDDDINSLQGELDMCKHLHTAAVSDLVEGANYHSGESPKSNIENGE